MKTKQFTRVIVVGTSVIAFLVYLLTLAPDLTWENFGVDGGELITAAYTWGVPHPPGYPTYVILGKLFSYLPIGTIAYRFNLFSAVCMAVATGFVTKTAVFLTPHNDNSTQVDAYKNRLGSAAVGLSFAFAPLVWSQATIAEVYALNLALLAALVWALVTKLREGLVGLLFGLSLTTHLTSIFFAPLVFWLTPKSKWKQVSIGSIIGLMPYLFIFVLAHSGSPVSWGNAGTAAGWWWLISGQAYQGYAFSLPGSELGGRVLSWGWTLLNQFSLLGLPFALIGGYQLTKQAPYRRLVWGGMITAVLLFIYALTYNTADAIILLLPILLITVMFFTPIFNSVGPIGLFLPLSLLLLNFNSLNLQQNDLRGRVLDIIEETPSQAIVITPGDATIFTLWYFQQIESIRPDLVLVDSDLFAFEWYRQQLADDYPNLRALERDDLDAFETYNSQSRSLCRMSLTSTTGAETNLTCKNR